MNYQHNHWLQTNPKPTEEEMLKCPHCQGAIEIIALNCGIFRHAVYKDGRQFNPHAPKEECDSQLDLVYGCTKPFRVNIINNKYYIIACDYI